MTLAVYPNGIVPWTNRVDKVNTVFAADPNQLAAEIIAIEATVGTNPQVEYAPPVGNQVVYPSMSARLHDVQMGSQLPVVALTNNSFTVKSQTQIGNTFSSLYDPFSYFNGTDITIKANGWYLITMNQKVEWYSSGFMMIRITLAGDELTSDVWSWDFPENADTDSDGDSWEKNWRIMSATWQGSLAAGQRISATTWNGTSKGQVTCTESYLRASYIRSTPVYQGDQ